MLPRGVIKSTHLCETVAALRDSKRTLSRTEGLCVGTRARLLPEGVVLKSNDLSEAPEILGGGVLPLRRLAERRDFSVTDPALYAMTDFTHSVPISVAPERPIDEALADMMRFGVRALLVISGDSIVGLVTTHDILGPRPLAFAGRSNPAREHIPDREHIQVGDIMTGWDAMPTVDWSTMQSARIRDLLEIFDGTGATHLLVVEDGDRGVPVVRGLVSRGRIDRRLEA